MSFFSKARGFALAALAAVHLIPKTHFKDLPDPVLRERPFDPGRAGKKTSPPRGRTHEFVYGRGNGMRMNRLTVKWPANGVRP